MPLANGPFGNPRYDSQDLPKFSKYLTSVSDFYADLLSPVTSYADLANIPNKVAGMTKTDLETGGQWLYTGSGWTRLNKLVAEGSDNSSSSAQADGGTMLSFAFPAIAFATRITMQAVGAVGFRAAASSGAAHWTATGGALSQMNVNRVSADASAWSGWGQNASVDVPPNTATQLRLIADTVGGPYMTAGATVRRISIQ